MKIAFIYLGQQGGGVSIEYLEYAKGLSLYSEVLCVLSNKSKEFPLWKTEANQNKRLSILGGVGVSKWLVHSNGNTYGEMGNGANKGYCLVWDSVNKSYFILVDRASGREFSIPFTPL